MKNILKLSILTVAVTFYACTGNGQARQAKKSQAPQDTIKRVELTDAQWKAKLTPEQYYVLREKGTDRAFTGKYVLHNEKGVYSCAGCGQELFTSDMKFESECGWPSFDKELAGGRITQIEDRSYGMLRTEIVCTKCGSHLGHLFTDGPTLTGMRYCINSTSIDFLKKDAKPTSKKPN
ncbi:MAG TPA: peptide-methionine (R)-S-oxide reductase MsrB [Cyclobacteriaceae bacterium]|nr:peptide-methionine (R)-S-oxide reductase MsrB [Cyclobacteriaceae bacterium]